MTMEGDEHIFGNNGATQAPSTGTAAHAAAPTPETHSGGRRYGLRVLVYGKDGIGKTMLASDAPDPIIASTERGGDQYGAETNKKPFESWPEFMAFARFYARGKHNRRTFAVDALGGVQELIVKYICARDHGSNKGKLETMLKGRPYMEGYGYGKGWEVADQEWALLVPELETMSLRGMNVILIGHEMVHKEKNEEAFDYGVIGPNIHKLAMERLIKWSDIVTYCRFKQEVIDAGDTETKRAKIVNTGDRSMFTEARGGFRAKNRYSLPFEMEISWLDLELKVAENHPDQAVPLRNKIKEMLTRLSPEQRGKVAPWFRSVGTDVPKLRSGLGKIQKMLDGAPDAAPETPAGVPVPGTDKPAA